MFDTIRPIDIDTAVGRRKSNTAEVKRILQKRFITSLLRVTRVRIDSVVDGCWNCTKFSSYIYKTLYYVCGV